jgi:hypothetical protein
MAKRAAASAAFFVRSPTLAIIRDGPEGKTRKFEGMKRH